MNDGDDTVDAKLDDLVDTKVLVTEVSQLANEFRRDAVDTHLDEVVDRHLSKPAGLLPARTPAWRHECAS